MEVDLQVIWWLLTRAQARPGALDSIATMGSGPLEEHHFDIILSALGLKVYLPGAETELLIIGREGWSERTIHELLDARSGQHLRVYSQEMFVAYLITCQDPLAGDDATVRLLAGDHPALQFLESVGFEWPSTQVPPRGDGKIDAELLRLGFLKYKGYTVGKPGLTPHIRRQILIAVYEDTVPPGFPDYYIGQWGPPESAMRLRKMAESIAAFCRNNKKKGNPPTQAIEDWEADLAWLKSQLYDGRYRFRWPSTDVW